MQLTGPATLVSFGILIFNNFMDGKSGTVDTLTELAQKVNEPDCCTVNSYSDKIHCRFRTDRLCDGACLTFGFRTIEYSCIRHSGVYDDKMV